MKPLLAVLFLSSLAFAETPEQALPGAQAEAARVRLCLKTRGELHREYQAKVMAAVAGAPSWLVEELRLIVEELRASLSDEDRKQVRDGLAANWPDRVEKAIKPHYAEVAEKRRRGYCDKGKLVPLSVGLDENDPEVLPAVCHHQPDQYHDDVWVTDADQVRTVYWREFGGRVLATACRAKYHSERYYGQNSKQWLTFRRLDDPVCVTGDLLGGETPSPQPLQAVMANAGTGTPGLPKWTEYLRKNLDGSAKERCPEFLAGL
jgi:hypothetical protein